MPPTHIHPVSSLLRRSLRHAKAAAGTFLFLIVLGSPHAIVAQIFNGGGLEEGVSAAEGITGVSSDDPKNTIVSILEKAISFLALLGVTMIIIAGFYLILSLGEEDKKEKAKRIIFYTLIGLMVVLLAGVIVRFVTDFLLGDV